MEYLIELRKLVKAKIKELGLKRKFVAEKIGVSESVLCQSLNSRNSERSQTVCEKALAYLLANGN